MHAVRVEGDLVAEAGLLRRRQLGSSHGRQRQADVAELAFFRAGNLQGLYARGRNPQKLRDRRVGRHRHAEPALACALHRAELRPHEESLDLGPVADHLGPVVRCRLEQDVGRSRLVGRICDRPSLEREHVHGVAVLQQVAEFVDATGRHLGEVHGVADPLKREHLVANAVGHAARRRGHRLREIGIHRLAVDAAACDVAGGQRHAVLDDAGLGLVASRNHAPTQHFYLRLDTARLLDERVVPQVWSPTDGRFLPDRYVLGTCPHCRDPGARGDQCEACGTLLDPVALVAPRSALSGDTRLEIRENRHLFLRQSALRAALGDWLDSRSGWPPFVVSLAHSWLTADLRDRCITRDLTWGVPVRRLPTQCRLLAHQCESANTPRLCTSHFTR
ncbi:class I tRNA ligase family protein [Methylorubrum extorquens]|uniref:class I tRNA ligase family protein n=1 Tax=Methylorubrum extorquens TaxID=408 RepID=UPI00209F1D08|nr:class I tRNA ligase family protein [Methylorubrum extorquens]